MDEYIITWGSRAGEEVRPEDIYLTFPNGDVVLEEDAAGYLTLHPEEEEQ